MLTAGDPDGGRCSPFYETRRTFDSAPFLQLRMKSPGRNCFVIAAAVPGANRFVSLSDNPELAGGIELIPAEGADCIRIPGETVEGETDAVLREEICHILKEHIQMAGEETGF